MNVNLKWTKIKPKQKKKKNKEVKARCLGENLISVYLRQETI